MQQRKKEIEEHLGIDMPDEYVRKSASMDMKELADLHASCKEEAKKIMEQEAKEDKDRDKEWLREAVKKVKEQEKEELALIAAKKKAAAEAQQATDMRA